MPVPGGAGDLRTFVTIQQYTETRDVYGGASFSWSTFGTAWCAVLFTGGSEIVEADQRTSEIDLILRTRYMSGVLPKMRVLYGSRTFDIMFVVNIRERGEWMEIHGKERV